MKTNDNMKKPNQKLRKGILFISLMLFPITLNYLSPYVIIDGAMEGIINGSFIVFIGLFLTSLVFGRAFCAYICPGGGLMEFGGMVHNKTSKGGKRNLIKWFIWVPWIGIIITFAIMAGGYKSINMFHLTESGISVDSPSSYVIYLSVVFGLLLLTYASGKRAGCHYVCWMAPFMIIGTKIKNKLKYPSYHLEVETKKCTQCKLCTKSCPMSLDVTSMVQKGSMENVECILCGNCVATCRQGAISTAWKWNKI
jgi:polyferredoxin